MRTIFLLLLTAPAFCAAQVQVPAAPAAAAARHIRAGELITADALKEAPASPKALTAAQAAGSEAVRSIRPGETITQLMVRPARLVHPGDKVRVRGASGRVKVYAWFLALQGGSLGELVQARNQRTGKVLTVKVEGPGEAALPEVEK